MKSILIGLLTVSLGGCVVITDGSPVKAGGDTAVVCHKGKKTMALPQAAARAHLNHGDHPGAC